MGCSRDQVAELQAGAGTQHILPTVSVNQTDQQAFAQASQEAERTGIGQGQAAAQHVGAAVRGAVPHAARILVLPGGLWGGLTTTEWRCDQEISTVLMGASGTVQRLRSAASSGGPYKQRARLAPQIELTRGRGKRERYWCRHHSECLCTCAPAGWPLGGRRRMSSTLLSHRCLHKKLQDGLD